MSIVVWDYTQEDPMQEKYEQHTEFVCGIDFNLEIPGQIASCSWDETVYVWMTGEEPVATHEDFEDGNGDEDDDGDDGDDDVDAEIKGKGKGNQRKTFSDFLHSLTGSK